MKCAVCNREFNRGDLYYRIGTLNVIAYCPKCTGSTLVRLRRMIENAETDEERDAAKRMLAIHVARSSERAPA